MEIPAQRRQSKPESRLRRGRQPQAWIGDPREAGCSAHRVPQAAGRQTRHPRRTAWPHPVPGETCRRESVFTKNCGYGEVGLLLERSLGPQPVNREPPFEVAQAAGFRLEPDRAADLDHRKIVQVFALCGEQRGIARLRRTDLLRVV